MKSCRFENRIDDYLLNRLPEDKAAEFEEHYFNCAPCFAELTAREELLRVIKTGDVLRTAPEGVTAAADSGAWFRRLWAFLTPRQWALAGAAALALVAVAIILPRGRGPTPEFLLTDDDTVRGGAITLISPVNYVRTSPAAPFEWQSYGEGIEYKFFIANHKPMWETSATETSITLPEEIRAKLVPGETYVWQVKAFKKDGTLVAISSKVSFKVLP
ncbi:MAG: anti-sigma factor [Candidatus Aminicenantes bacterium]|nr:anti-sigma factor [Candidatus Aminicenantes bacterium]